jgi:hypothetical protein
MQSKWKIGLLIALLGAVAVFQSGCAPAVAQPQAPADTDEVNQRTISVSGSGSVSAAPDLVVVRLGVETMAETAGEALTQNSERMAAVINSLEEAGVPSENIQTRTVRLNPQYETGPQGPGQEGERELIGFRASNIVEARSEDLTAFGQLLDAAVQGGANRIEGLTFEVTDSSELLTQAREAAWTDAEDKAQELSALAGAALGNVLSINESTRAPRPVAFEAAEADQVARVPIEPGTQDIQVDLQVTWLLR